MKQAHCIYQNDDHRWLAIARDASKPGYLIDTNEYVVMDGEQALLCDPGGIEIFPAVFSALSAECDPTKLAGIFASHQDPDIIGSVDKWLLYTRASVVCSKLWGRFVPHLVPGYMENAGRERYLLVDDEGARIPLGDNAEIVALPAHFLHSVGNLSFFDPVSRILFPGDVCSGLVNSGVQYGFVEDFEAYRPCMEGFHKRYMASNRALRLWVEMVRELAPAMIVPQHGMPFRGAAIKPLLDWLEGLQCGVDLMGPVNYRPNPQRPPMPARY